MFDDMIADVESDKKLSSIVTELFFKRKKTQYFTRYKALEIINYRTIFIFSERYDFVIR